jgi:hypothetical protein|tara:strand:+ start:169 stop:1002 length:834 start_codon:yes stop_codon:yes gene_type:complete
MKKLILLLSIGLLITSCSSEENEIPEIQTQVLVKIEQRQFDFNNGALTEKIIFEYNNQRPTIALFYDENNQLTYTSEWNYSNNNFLSSIKGYLPSGTLDSETNITYDSSNRIIQTKRSEENSTYLTTTDFTHNSNNTITSNTNSNGNISSKTFEINNIGIIDKEVVNGNVIVSVQYEDLKPISKTSYSTSYNYTYLVSGSFPSSFQSIFGNNTVNVVLFQNSLDNSLESFTTELIKKVESNSTIIEYTYTLNNDNYPLTKKDFYNGKLENEFDYYYE